MVLSTLHILAVFHAVPYLGSSRVVDPESRSLSTDVNYWINGIFYNGFVHATTVFPDTFGGLSCMHLRPSE
jgi:hypothetical protein